jgi:hypothetical protein
MESGHWQVLMVIMLTSGCLEFDYKKVESTPILPYKKQDSGTWCLRALVSTQASAIHSGLG